jgi:hypothetical protein
VLTYGNIFWRTFAQLATGVLSAALLVDWTTDYKASATVVGLGLLTALIGGVVAAGWAYVKSPADTPLQKAVRSLVQFVVSGVAAISINSVADLVSFPRLAVPIAVGAVLSFALTFLQNQGAVEG